jgi:hypothetical protein
MQWLKGPSRASKVGARGAGQLWPGHTRARGLARPLAPPPLAPPPQQGVSELRSLRAGVPAGQTVAQRLAEPPEVASESHPGGWGLGSAARAGLSAWGRDARVSRAPGGAKGKVVQLERRLSSTLTVRRGRMSLSSPPHPKAHIDYECY